MDSHDQSSGDENKITVVVCGSDEEDEEETASAPDDDSDEYDVDVGVAGRRSRRLIRSRANIVQPPQQQRAVIEISKHV